MRVKRLLAAFLLSVGLCFVPALGYGEVEQGILEDDEAGTFVLEFHFLQAKVKYIMRNPTVFLNVDFDYDSLGFYGWFENFPENVDTKGKIFVTVIDNRDLFTYKSGTALRDQFKKSLEVIYSFIDDVATNMYTDIVAKFYSKEANPLGYFYQGEYHL